MEAEAVEPALDVTNSAPDARPGEGLVVRSVAVALEAGVDVRALVFGNETGCIWVVRDETICEHRDNNGEDALDDEDPTPASQASYAFHFDDCAGEKTY